MSSISVITLLNSYCTKAVVAIYVLLVPVDAVGAVGVPVSAGLAFGANVDNFLVLPSLTSSKL